MVSKCKQTVKVKGNKTFPLLCHDNFRLTSAPASIYPLLLVVSNCRGHLQSAITLSSGLARWGSRLQSPTTRLHALAVDARGTFVASRALLAGVVDVDYVEGVEMTRYIPVVRGSAKC